MPSDAKKKKEQQKKEARKKKDIKKPANSANDADQVEDDEQDDQDQQNEEEESTTTNGTATNGTTNGDATTTTKAKPVRNPFDMTEIKNHLEEVLQVEKMNAENRACTGVLASHPNGRDTHIHQFSITFYGQELVVSRNFFNFYLLFHKF